MPFLIKTNREFCHLLQYYSRVFHQLYGSDLNARVLEQCYSVSDLYIAFIQILVFVVCVAQLFNLNLIFLFLYLLFSPIVLIAVMKFSV